MRIYPYLFLLLLLTHNSVTGQKSFEPLLKPLENSKDFFRNNPEVHDAVVAEVNNRFLSRILNSGIEVFEASIPLDNYGEHVDLHFNSFDLVTDNFEVLNSLGQEVDYNYGKYYSAMGKEDDVFGAFSFYEDKLMGMLSYSNGVVYNIGEILSNDNKYIVYRDADFDAGLTFYCATDDNVEEVKDMRDIGNLKGRSSDKCIDLYAEADYALYVKNGKNISKTVDFVLGLFAESALLYKKEGVNIKISRIKVWDSHDNYSTKTSNEALDQFVDRNRNGDMDLGILLALGANGLGGLAYINGLCTNRRHFCYANINDKYNNIPIYSWSAMVITHELGHNLGSNHTHSCSWNGNGTQIDDCGNLYYFRTGRSPEGRYCFDEDNPIIPDDGGTIMSYCHLIGSAGINLSKGFGEQPNKVINRVIANADCLDACDGTAEEAPVADFEGQRNFTCVGGELKFIDKSLNHPGEWIWLFENDKGVDTSYHKFPRERYRSMGTYDVSLVAINDKGKDTLTKVDYIKVIEGPKAEFEYEFIEDNRVKFHNKSTLSDRYFWKFGDGLVSLSANPKHRYREGGLYVVKLRAFRDTCSTYAYFTDTIEVKIPLKAKFSATSRGICRGDTITFKALNENYDSVKWEIKGGEVINKGKREIRVLYKESGTFDVGLIAFSKYGNDTIQKDEYIDVLFSPEPIFDYNISNDTIFFQNNSLNSTGYIWYFNGVKSSFTANPIYKFGDANDVDVTLVAVNKCDSSVLSKKIITTDVEDLGEEVGLFIYPNPNSGKFRFSSTFGINGESNLIIYNIYGKIVYDEKFSGIHKKHGEYTIDISGLKSGLYYMSLLSKSNTVYKKAFVVIEK